MVPLLSLLMPKMSVLDVSEAMETAKDMYTTFYVSIFDVIADLGLTLGAENFSVPRNSLEVVKGNLHERFQIAISCLEQQLPHCVLS